MNPRTVPNLHRSILFGGASALGALALGAGCSGKPLPPPPTLPPLTHAPAPAAAPSDAPARWVYHPTSHEPALTVRPLEEGGCLSTALHGQRWVTTPAPDRKAGQGDRAVSPTHAPPALVESCGTKATAATEPAPEELIAIVRPGEHMFRFVGQSGAIYEANEPLAPLRRVAAAPDQPFVKASGEGDVVLGVTLDGKLFRFTGTDGYHQVALTPPDGRLFDVAMSSRGRALALAAPEALFTSGDGGVTWERAPVPTIGVQRVRRMPSGNLLAEGPLGSYEWSDKLPLTAAPSRLPVKLPAGDVATHLEVPPVPAAGAVKYGTHRSVGGGVAVLDGDRYAQVRKPADGTGTWRLLKGKLDGHLKVAPLPQSKSCQAVSLGGRGEYLFTSCHSEGDTTVEVRRSADFGETWSAPLTLIRGRSRVDIGVSPDGNALITGVCLPTATKGGACEPITPLWIEAIGARLQATPTVAPELQPEAAYSPAYAVDGRSAYFLAGEVARQRDAQEHPSDLKLFVSHDEGKTFSARPVKVDTPPVLYLPGDPQKRPFPDNHTLCAGLSPGADGTLGLWVDAITSDHHLFEEGDLLPRYAGAYLTMDADGRGLRQVSPPAENAMLGGFGRRLIAFAHTSQEGTTDRAKIWEFFSRTSAPLTPSAEHRGMTRLWESSDGGVTWEPKGLPDMLANGLMSPGMRDESVACAAGGCLVGNMLTRVGWGGPSAPARPEPAPAAGDDPSSTALTPIVCELSQGTPWASTAPLVISQDTLRDNEPLLPDARMAMRGRSVWSSLLEDGETDAVSTVRATLPESGEGAARITMQLLLGPVRAWSPGMQRVSHRSYKREGYVALRAAFPLDPNGRTPQFATIRDVEVGWENDMEGTSGHGRIPAAVASKFTLSGDSYIRTHPVSGTAMKVDGVAVIPNVEDKGWSPAFTLDAKGRTEYIPYPSSTFHRSGDSSDGDKSLAYSDPDLVRIGSKLLGVRLMRGMVDIDRWNEWHVSDGMSNPLVVLFGSPTGPAATALRQGVDPWSWSALTLTPSGDSLANAYASDASWTYAGKTTRGLVSYVVEKRQGRAYASFYALRADGTLAPPVPVATLSDLGDQPRACTAVERATSARLVSAMHWWEGYESEVFFPGLRHPVLVREATGQGTVLGSAPVSLLTGAAVTHGTPSSACVAAWEATSPTHEQVSAILSGDLTHSWMFRLRHVQYDNNWEKSGEALEYRPMSCHFDPSARVPEQVKSPPPD